MCSLENRGVKALPLFVCKPAGDIIWTMRGDKVFENKIIPVSKIRFSEVFQRDTAMRKGQMT